MDNLTERIIGCAIEVHRHLGPGLLESVYEAALVVELDLAGIHYQRQHPLKIVYKGMPLGDYRMDLVIEKEVVVELKSVERHDPLFEAQLLSYMKLGKFKVGLLINFNTHIVSKGIKRFVL